ncbi:MAG: hypothetical protein AAFU61_11870, partial [Pseudomonadota bacterium]
ALEADPDLRGELADMLHERDALLAAARVEEIDPAAKELAARLGDRLDKQRRRRGVLRLAASAAGLGAMAGAGWFGHVAATAPRDAAVRVASAPGIGGAGAVPRFVADAAGAHEVFAFDTVHPVEFFSQDEALMRDWFAGHLGADVKIPHLEQVGFDLIGGRLLGSAEGPTAQLIYANAKGDRVSLVFGRQALPGGGDSVQLVRVGKTYAGWWRQDDLSWAVVEDQPGSDVGAVARQVSDLIRSGDGLR